MSSDTGSGRDQAPSASVIYDPRANAFSFRSPDMALDFFATLCLKVTGACAASCAFCSEPDRLLPSVPASEWKPLVVDAAKAGTRRFSLSGGEPLLYFDLHPLLQIIKEAGGTTFLATAASETVLRHSGRLGGLLDSVRFSVLGVGDAHDRQLGQQGAFASLEEAIRACRQNNIEVFASTVATTEIVPLLPEIVAWTAKQRIPKLYVFELLDSGNGSQFRMAHGEVRRPDLLEMANAVRIDNVSVIVIPNDLFGANVLCYADGRVIVDPAPTPSGQLLVGNWRDEGILGVWKNFSTTPAFVNSISQRARLY